MVQILSEPQEDRFLSVSERRIALSKPLHHAASRMSQLPKSSSAASQSFQSLTSLVCQEAKGQYRKSGEKLAVETRSICTRMLSPRH